MSYHNKRDRIGYIDERELARGLKRVSKEIVREIRDTVMERAIANIESLSFKDNTVRMESGRVVSDASRKQALINSFDIHGGVKDHVDNVMDSLGRQVVTGYVSAMGKNFKDSHIGWYYEVGTGEHEDPAGYDMYDLPTTLGEPNPYRSPEIGAPIVSRYRGDGPWEDFGGNLRASKSPVGGVGSDTIPKDINGNEFSLEEYEKMRASFRESIGEDIIASYWFDRAVQDTRKEILEISIKHLKDADLMNPKNGILHVPKRIRISGTDGYEVLERY